MVLFMQGIYRKENYLCQWIYIYRVCVVWKYYIILNIFKSIFEFCFKCHTWLTLKKVNNGLVIKHNLI